MQVRRRRVSHEPVAVARMKVAERQPLARLDEPRSILLKVRHELQVAEFPGAAVIVWEILEYLGPHLQDALVAVCVRSQTEIAPVGALGRMQLLESVEYLRRCPARHLEFAAIRERRATIHYGVERTKVTALADLGIEQE